MNGLPNFKWLLLLPFLAFAACDESEETSSDSTSARDASEEAKLVTAGFVWPPAEYALAEGVQVASNVYRDNYLLVIDTSTSMAGGNMEAARQAGQEYVDKIPSDASIGLVTFPGGVLVPLGPDNHARVKEAVSNLRANGGTPMVEGLQVSYQELARAAAEQLGYGTYNLAVIGDGQPASGTKGQVKGLIDHFALQTPVKVTAVGYGMDLPVLNRPLTNYFQANDLSGLSEALAFTLAESKGSTASGDFSAYMTPSN